MVRVVIFARLIFSIVDFGVREGLSAPLAPGSDADGKPYAQQRAWRTGALGETYAYWHLRRHGYILARAISPIPEEIDRVGYDGSVLAFVEVKTRTIVESWKFVGGIRANFRRRRELAKNAARQFLRARHIESAECRFDVLAIKTRPGAEPCVRLRKGAFSALRN